jgi:hypothetical protein
MCGALRRARVVSFGSRVWLPVRVTLRMVHVVVVLYGMGCHSLDGIGCAGRSSAVVNLLTVIIALIELIRS